MSKRDYYEVLGLARDAADGDVKSAYRKAALQFHPDRNPGNKEAEEKFKEASEAYDVLSNPDKRATYDRFGHQGLSGQGFHGFQDVGDVFSSMGSIFEEFFGFGGGGGGRSRTRRGSDLRYDLALEFEEAVFGCEKEIEFERATACDKCEGSGAKPGTGKAVCKGCNGHGQVRRNQGFFSIATPCPACGGEGQVIESPCQGCKGRGRKMARKSISVKVPAGVDTGLRLRVGGEGEAGVGGGPGGDLYVVLHVKESETFVRDGLDLVMHQPLSIAQAALGCKMKVKALDAEHAIEVPAGTQYGHRVTVHGAGVPHLRGTGRGDLHVEFSIVVPKKLSKEQRELLVKFAEISGEEVGGSGGIFRKIFSPD